MKSLKLKLYQNMCNYRKEGSFRYVETYPLPTPSMIRGMVHSILGLKEYKPLLISIQGENQGIITNLQRVYKFDRLRETNEYKVVIDQSQKTATHGIMNIDLHIHMNLIIHISLENNNEELLNELYRKVQEEIVIIGRNEDFALVEDAKIVDVERNENSTYAKHNMYVREDNIDKDLTQFVRYRLPFWYHEVSSFEDNRIFEFVEVYYIGKGTELMNVMFDSEDDIVCFISGNK